MRHQPQPQWRVGRRRSNRAVKTWGLAAILGLGCAALLLVPSIMLWQRWGTRSKMTTIVTEPGQYYVSDLDMYECRDIFGLDPTLCCPARCPPVEVDANNPGRDQWYKDQLDSFGDTPKANGWDYTPEIVRDLMKPLEIQPGDIVLELGSGTGRFLQMAADTVPPQPPIRGIGVELLDFYVEHARKHYPRFLHCCGSAANISFIPDDTAAAVFSNFVLNAVPTSVAAEVVEEALRVVKPGGRVLFGCINTVERAPSYQYGLDKAWWMKVAKQHGLPPPRFQPSVFASQGYRYDVYLLSNNLNPFQ